MTEELQKKINQAVRLIQSFASNKQVVEVCYSGGKDSDVILELAKMAGIKYIAIYKNTTIDPPGTIQHCKDKNVKILQPKTTFFKLIEKSGFPTRRARFCCKYLKEYKVLNYSIQGIRRSESNARRKRYKVNEPVVCRFYGSKKKHVNVCLPILSWTNENIKEFIEKRNIKCHPIYYDKEGNFHPERRLGCMGCPLKSDRGKKDFKDYPNLFKQYIKAGHIWWKNHPKAKSIKKFGDFYGLVAHNLFYKSYKEWKAASIGIFGKRDWKEELECYFKIKLI